MNIYYIWIDNYDYDHYDGFVVVASSEEQAMHLVNEETKSRYYDFPYGNDLNIRIIGDAWDKIPASVILGSFNAA